MPYDKGLFELGDSCYAYLQPDGSWGWSNAGLIVDGEESLLVDTLFDRPLTVRTLASYQPHILLDNGPTGFVDNGGTNPAPKWKVTVIGKYNITDAFSISVLEKFRTRLRWTGIVNTPAKPPIPALQGLFGKPTIINNVLSFAAVPYILAEGGEA